MAANGAYPLKSEGASKTAQALGAAAAGAVSSATNGTGLNGGTITTSGTCAINLFTLTNSLDADSDEQKLFRRTDRRTGRVRDLVRVRDRLGAGRDGPPYVFYKSWYGTTVIASASATTRGANFVQAISLSGTLASPVGNIRISCKDIQSANGKIVFNSTDNSNDRHSIPYE